MSTGTTIPMMIEPEAEERLAELDLRREFEQMLEHARQTIPGLSRIEVTLPPRYELGGDPVVSLKGFLLADTPDPNDCETEYDRWVFQTFTPEIYQHFILLIASEAAHGR